MPENGEATMQDRPNIIIMYADDLGFGDVGCYGAKSIPTPNIDRLAKEGLLFHQGYATAATCTPSRYSLLTGSYPWRNKQAAILPGDAPLIIAENEQTLPAMLKQAGYRTGIVGKWHLGLGNGDLDWNNEINRTPNDVGFEYSYIMGATNDRVPCVYIENRKVAGLDPADPIEVSYDGKGGFPGIPTGKNNPELLKLKHSHGHDGTIINGIGRIGHMRGGKAALWDDETMAEVFAEKAVSFVRDSGDRPFFLYYAFHQPHAPRLPGPRFKGATPHGARGDVIVELDWCVGQMLEALDKLGIRENTIVIFSSDNGPVLDDGYADKAVELAGDHKPAGPLRGGKYSLYDGGTRVPFIVSWPGHIKAGETDALVSQVDFLASFATMTGQTLDGAAAPDSMNVMDSLLGRSGKGRDELVAEGSKGRTFIRQSNWAYIPSYEGPAKCPSGDTGIQNEPQLYDLSQDVGQIRNLAAENKDLVEKMSKRLDEIRQGNMTR
ncbi:MAG: sulfatase family protein [Kiritimatiellia bacterium]